MLRLFGIGIIAGEFRTEEEHPENQEYDRELYKNDQPKGLSDFHVPEAVAIKIIYLFKDVHLSNLTKKPDRRQPVRFLIQRLIFLLVVDVKQIAALVKLEFQVVGKLNFIAEALLVYLCDKRSGIISLNIVGD